MLLNSIIMLNILQIFFLNFGFYILRITITNHYYTFINARSIFY